MALTSSDSNAWRIPAGGGGDAEARASRPFLRTAQARVTATPAAAAATKLRRHQTPPPFRPARPNDDERRRRSAPAPPSERRLRGRADRSLLVPWPAVGPQALPRVVPAPALQPRLSRGPAAQPASEDLPSTSLDPRSVPPRPASRRPSAVPGCCVSFPHFAIQATRQRTVPFPSLDAAI